MEDYDFNTEAHFVYNKEQEVANNYKCDKTPPLCPNRGDENYYIWRFDNFMMRHVDCDHAPPVYYCGSLVDERSIAKPKSETNKNKSWLEKSKDIWDETTLNPQQIVLGLDKKIEENQQGVQQYTKNDKTVVPKLSGSYGYKYCVAFGTLLKPRLSEKGQAWITETLLYLQKYMDAGLVDRKWIAVTNTDFNERYGLYKKEEREKFYTNIELNNAKFKDFAFATHPDAYLDGGLKMLPYGDLLKIMCTPDLTEWKEWVTWEQAGNVAPEVLEQKAKEALKKIMNGLDKINKS